MPEEGPEVEQLDEEVEPQQEQKEKGYDQNSYEEEEIKDNSGYNYDSPDRIN